MRALSKRASAGLLLLVPITASAHGAAQPLDPYAMIAVAATAVGYGYGVARRWRRRIGHGVRPWRAACFAGGLVALALALIWPLDALSQSSFAAHMAQHMLLIAVAPPLLVLGTPLAPLAALAPARWTFPLRRPWQWLSRPAVAFALHGATLWAWHAPALFQSALRVYALHLLEHAMLFGTGLLFWWSLLHAGARHATGYGTSATLALLTIMHMGLLGALLTFAPHPLYPMYTAPARAFGLTALEGQQLAGLLMWIPSAFVYLAAGLALVAAWLRHAERRSRSRSRPGPLAARDG